MLPLPSVAGAKPHPVEPPPPPTACAVAGGALVLAGIEGARGRRLDPDVELFVTAFGNAFLFLAAIWLVTRDLDSLSSFLFHPPPAPLGGGGAPPPN